MATADVLVVDDEPTVREVLVAYLTREGHQVRSAGDGRTALDLIAERRPDLVVLDLMLPEVDGWEILRRLRSGPDVAVIVLSARGAESERVDGLELGADDYVVKPFSAREIVARVRAVLRRRDIGSDAGAEPIVLGDLVIDPNARVVTRAGEPLELPPRELDLLAFLASHPGRAFSRAELLEKVWQSSAEWQDPGTVTVHVRRLRGRIEDDPMEPRHLVTVYGVGYRCDP